MLIIIEYGANSRSTLCYIVFFPLSERGTAFAKALSIEKIIIPQAMGFECREEMLCFSQDKHSKDEA